MSGLDGQLQLVIHLLLFLTDFVNHSLTTIGGAGFAEMVTFGLENGRAYDSGPSQDIFSQEGIYPAKSNLARQSYYTLLKEI